MEMSQKQASSGPVGAVTPGLYGRYLLLMFINSPPGTETVGRGGQRGARAALAQR